jgi:murein L,D-transpeptidase YafK
MLLFALIAAVVAALVWANVPTGQLPLSAKADRVVVNKAQRQLSLYHGSQLLKTYAVSLGGNPLGAKQQEGDQKTPEGSYTIDWRNDKSSYHRALHVSYPEARDVTAAAARGVPPGGEIMVHGAPNGYGFIGKLHRLKDWTAGCIAVTDTEIEEIWAAVSDGTRIEITP